MEVSQYSQSTLPEINSGFPVNHAPLKSKFSQDLCVTKYLLAVHFDQNCKKCHGTGLKRNYCWFNGLLFKKIPCQACYNASDVCYKCEGRQVNSKGNF